MMGIKRNNTQLVVEKSVTSNTDIISKITIDVTYKKIDVEITHGNAIGEEFEVVSIERIEIADKEARTGYIEELVILPGNKKVLLEGTPLNTGLRVEFEGAFLFMGSDWTLDENEITFLNLKKDDVVKVRYTGEIGATTDFTDIITSKSNGGKNFYENIELILFNKLTELGYIDGVIEVEEEIVVP